MATDLAIYRGEVQDERDIKIDKLQREVERLRSELTVAQAEATHAKSEAVRAVTALRRQLTPLYRALQAVFGEMEDIGGSDTTEGAQAAPQSVGGRDARQMTLWNDWKAKLPPTCGKVIDALLLHSDLSIKQIEATAHMGRRGVYEATARLGQLGLTAKNGGRFSLKQL